MLRSGNDAAIEIAYRVAGGIEPFADMMNNLAEKLELKNSHFTNPHGLDDPNHYTSAYDLAKITSFALNNEIFSEIVKTKSIRICEGQENYRYLVNKNKLLFSMPDCIGVKTGYTKKAGRCLVSASEQNNMKVVCVVLDCGPMFEECARLIENGFEKYKIYNLIDEYSVGDEVKVLNGEKDFVKTITKNSFSYPLSDEEYLNVSIVRNQPENLEAEVKKDVSIGTLEIYLGKDLLNKQEIYTLENVKSIKYLDKIWEVVDNWNI